MFVLYTFFVRLIKGFIPVVGWVNPKVKRFYQGRQYTDDKIKSIIRPHNQVIWMHCASLGEFEQGRPVFERLKRDHPSYKMLLTFFSPSGYDVRQNYDQADLVLYLPWDTPKDINRFLDLTHPSMALFVKYELWPNLLKTLQQRAIPTLLFSGIFRADQPYFKYRWFKELLLTFDKIFVQDQTSLDLLRHAGIKDVEVNGDTRFDRVYDVSRQAVDLPLIEQFCDHARVLVAGSTWPKDEDFLVAYINNHARENEKFIIAPHETHKTHLDNLEQKINKPFLRYSRLSKENSQSVSVLIIDSIGLLSHLYRFGQMAYVGGGFGSGIHNILEAATYGIPIIIGPNYKKFNEANELIALGGCLTVSTKENGVQQISELMKSPETCQQMGNISKAYIGVNTGATSMVVQFVPRLLSNY